MARKDDDPLATPPAPKVKPADRFNDGFQVAIDGVIVGDGEAEALGVASKVGQKMDIGPGVDDDEDEGAPVAPRGPKA